MKLVLLLAISASLILADANVEKVKEEVERPPRQDQQQQEKARPDTAKPQAGETGPSREVTNRLEIESSRPGPLESLIQALGLADFQPANPVRVS